MPRESLQMCSKTESLCGSPVPQSQRESESEVPTPVPPRRQPLPPPSEAGEGICSSEEGSGVRTVPSHREDRYPIPVAPGVPLGWRATSHLCGGKDVLEDTAASTVVL